VKPVEKLKNIEIENNTLREIIKDTLWMARRYADGRMTYAAITLNEALDRAASIGLTVEDDATLKDPKYATDGNFGFWDKASRRFIGENKS